ncbi:MAG: hypothetical protein HY680_05255 [Chloroflexi bacterium]|nr:hypothetical protein [Chloroflexota bacterium]
MEAVLQWLGENWGNLASVVGLMATVVGLSAAIWQLVRTRKAAEAAREAAQEATRTAREALAKSLTIGDLKTAISLLEKVKLFHRTGKWEMALEWYQPIRVALTDARVRYPGLGAEQVRRINAGIAQMSVMANEVDQALRLDQLPPANMKRITERLNAIQSSLESLVSDLQMTETGNEGGPKNG